MNLKIGVVGYGEVGTILSRALSEKGLAWVGAWDVLFRDSIHAPAMKVRACEHRVDACESLAALLARADIVISAVTPANALDVASWMAAATADKQAWIAALARSGWFRELASGSSWQDYADRIIVVPENSKKRSSVRCTMSPNLHDRQAYACIAAVRQCQHSACGSEKGAC